MVEYIALITTPSPMNLLFARTFTIIAGMLLITAATARVNKTFETKTEMWLTILGMFGLLFACLFTANMFPLNLILVAAFSGVMGWTIGPTIENIGQRYKMKTGHAIVAGAPVNREQQWNTIISQALFGTAIAVAATAGLVFATDIDFSPIGGFLFIALIILIVMGLLNIFFFKSERFALIRAYFGVIIFTGYLLYDFNVLEKSASDQTWGTAVRIAVSIYIDIINLFLDLLYILAATSD